MKNVGIEFVDCLWNFTCEGCQVRWKCSANEESKGKNLSKDLGIPALQNYLKRYVPVSKIAQEGDRNVAWAWPKRFHPTLVGRRISQPVRFHLSNSRINLSGKCSNYWLLLIFPFAKECKATHLDVRLLITPVVVWYVCANPKIEAIPSDVIRYYNKHRNVNAPIPESKSGMLAARVITRRCSALRRSLHYLKS